MLAAESGGTIARWMQEFGCVAALVRPDRYVFGVAQRREDVGRLIVSLRAAVPSGSDTLGGKSR